MPVGDTDPFRPDVRRPVRVRARTMTADTHFEPHRHAWAQLAYSASGMLQVIASSTPDSGDEVTYIVPPSRAVWIAPGARHAIHVLESAEFRTLYMDPSVTPAGWQSCRMIGVTPLLRELIQALDAPAGSSLAPAREQALAQLVMEEIAHADALPLGVPMPHPQSGDKRLRALCDAIVHAPAERATLAEWARDFGASERTVARLFREELGTGYQQWRQQVILAHALPMLARGAPVSEVAAASGYASDSAFSAMFKSAMGQPPSQFQNKIGL
ncbi:MAG: helix-turn-helix transcriptional regulator [Ramlibacter sp.]|nr:helix-turn-helix transcriptional regulator [Ramlibacter sp.]MBX3659162.1 helix-turn-helix transcriptional regulator [Ramlibacter sp.]MCW5650466.1 helix-turn-helix transcriptional regulator [Ramlibacter sp.]